MKRVKQLISIIKKDCMIGGRNINEVGETCVIGALGLAAGMSEKTMRKNYVGGSIDQASNIKLAKQIQKYFGLSIEEMANMQELNDEEETPAARRRNILKYIRKLNKLKK